MNRNRFKTFDGAIIRHPEVIGLTDGPIASGNPTVTNFNNQLLVFYKDTFNDIWYLFGNDNWGKKKLTGSSSLTAGPMSASDPIIINFRNREDKNEMHICYRDFNGNIWHIDCKGNGTYELEQLTGLNSQTGGPIAAGDPVMAFFSNLLYVFYRDNNGIIYFVVRMNKWSLYNLKKPEDISKCQIAFSDPAVLVYDDPEYGEQIHICYRNENSYIQHFSYCISTNTRKLEEVRGHGNPPAAGDVAIIMYNYYGQQPAPLTTLQEHFNILYRDTVGNIIRLGFIPSAGQNPGGWECEYVIGPNGKLDGVPVAKDPIAIKYSDILYIFHCDGFGNVWRTVISENRYASSKQLIGPGSELGGPVTVGLPAAITHGDGSYLSILYRDGEGLIWDVTNKALNWKLHQLTGPRSFRYLREHFGTQPPDSLRSLLIRMGPFNPETDAFRFRNYPGFHMTHEYSEQIAKWFADEVSSVAKRGGAPFRDTMMEWVYEIPVVGDVLKIPDVIIDQVVNQVIELIAEELFDILKKPFTGTYGRCGGMAFAGYDFYQCDWPVDERLGTIAPDEGTLGDYITDRLFDSLRSNAGTFLEWIMVLHIYPWLSRIATQILLALLTGPIAGIIQLAIGEEADFFNLGGPQELLSKTKSNWAWLKQKLDWEAAWPIGIVFGNKILPWDQHQILAVGYTDTGNGIATLDVWENNDASADPLKSGPKVRRLTINFTGDELQISNFSSDNPVKGIFVEKFAPKIPPQSLNLS